VDDFNLILKIRVLKADVFTIRVAVSERGDDLWRHDANFDEIAASLGPVRQVSRVADVLASGAVLIVAAITIPP
jgi:hypothetical protein